MWRNCNLLTFSSELFYWHVEYGAAIYDHIWQTGQAPTCLKLEKAQDIISKITKVSLPKRQED